MIQDAGAILVVDDDVDTVANLVDILGDEGYRLDCAHDGESALNLAKIAKFAVSIVDYRMPEMNGATLIEELQKLQPEIKTIMMTGFADEEGIAQAVEAGVLRVFSKPVDLEALLELTEQAALSN